MTEEFREKTEREEVKALWEKASAGVRSRQRITLNGITFDLDGKAVTDADGRAPVYADDDTTALALLDQVRGTEGAALGINLSEEAQDEADSFAAAQRTRVTADSQRAVALSSVRGEMANERARMNASEAIAYEDDEEGAVRTVQGLALRAALQFDSRVPALASTAEGRPAPEPQTDELVEAMKLMLSTGATPDDSTLWLGSDANRLRSIRSAITTYATQAERHATAEARRAEGQAERDAAVAAVANRAPEELAEAIKALATERSDGQAAAGTDYEAQLKALEVARNAIGTKLAEAIAALDNRAELNTLARLDRAAEIQREAEALRKQADKDREANDVLVRQAQAEREAARANAAGAYAPAVIAAVQAVITANNAPALRTPQAALDAASAAARAKVEERLAAALAATNRNLEAQVRTLRQGPQPADRIDEKVARLQALFAAEKAKLNASAAVDAAAAADSANEDSKTKFEKLLALRPLRRASIDEGLARDLAQTNQTVEQKDAARQRAAENKVAADKNLADELVRELDTIVRQRAREKEARDTAYGGLETSERAARHALIRMAKTDATLADEAERQRQALARRALANDVRAQRALEAAQAAVDAKNALAKAELAKPEAGRNPGVRFVARGSELQETLEEATKEARLAASKLQQRLQESKPSFKEGDLEVMRAEVATAIGAGQPGYVAGDLAATELANDAAIPAAAPYSARVADMIATAKADFNARGIERLADLAQARVKREEAAVELAEKQAEMLTLLRQARDGQAEKTGIWEKAIDKIQGPNDGTAIYLQNQQRQFVERAIEAEVAGLQAEAARVRNMYGFDPLGAYRDEGADVGTRIAIKQLTRTEAVERALARYQTKFDQAQDAADNAQRALATAFPDGEPAGDTAESRIELVRYERTSKQLNLPNLLAVLDLEREELAGATTAVDFDYATPLKKGVDELKTVQELFRDFDRLVSSTPSLVATEANLAVSQRRVVAGLLLPVEGYVNRRLDDVNANLRATKARRRDAIHEQMAALATRAYGLSFYDFVDFLRTPGHAGGLRLPTAAPSVSQELLATRTVHSQLFRAITGGEDRRMTRGQFIEAFTAVRVGATERATFEDSHQALLPGDMKTRFALQTIKRAGEPAGLPPARGDGTYVYNSASRYYRR